MNNECHKQYLKEYAAMCVAGNELILSILTRGKHQASNLPMRFQSNVEGFPSWSVTLLEKGWILVVSEEHWKKNLKMPIREVYKMLVRMSPSDDLSPSEFIDGKIRRLCGVF